MPQHEMRKGAYEQMRNAVETYYAYRERFALSVYNSFPVLYLADTDYNIKLQFTICQVSS